MKQQKYGRGEQMAVRIIWKENLEELKKKAEKKKESGKLVRDRKS
jgi:hypothetical protein